MVSRILSKNSSVKSRDGILLQDGVVSGFSLVELILSISVILILFTVILLIVRPVEQLKKSRDNKRLSDISLIERAVIEYHVDTGVYPDDENTLRQSTVLPAGSASLANATSGWIKQNLSDYTSRLPLDPINDSTYFYKYTHNSNTYELNATLEFYTEYAQNDGGDDAAAYEVGNGLTLITP